MLPLYVLARPTGIANTVCELKARTIDIYNLYENLQLKGIIINANHDV